MTNSRPTNLQFRDDNQESSDEEFFLSDEKPILPASSTEEQKNQTSCISALGLFATIKDQYGMIKDKLLGANSTPENREKKLVELENKFRLTPTNKK